MKEKIDELAKGIFRSDRAIIEFTPSQLELETDAGGYCDGVFSVSNSENRVMKGIISTDCHYVELEQKSFQSECADIVFRFDAEGLTAGEIIKGNICVITDCGSARIQFSVTVNVPSCMVSSGRIKDLFHFANLAKEDSDEAMQLFKNKHFEEIFLYRDNANIALYRGISAGTSKRIAMEEFLIAINKKSQVQLSVDRSSFFYEECYENFMDKVIIKKDNWGFGEFHIESDAEFVKPEHKIIWTDNFAGNKYILPFLIDYEKMSEGNNYGRIFISSVRQTIEIEISAVKKGTKHDKVLDHIERQYKLYHLVELYIDFCLGRIDKDEYITSIEDVILNLESKDTSIVSELYKVHLGIMDNREKIVSKGFSHLDDMAGELRKNDIKLYCAYLYLKGLWESDNNEKKECIRRIKECYSNKEHSWQIFWMLMYLDEDYNIERVKFDEILKHLREGCNSPVMFYEICCILNSSPEWLRELTPEIIKCIHWGCKNDFLEEELIIRYTYLAGHMKNYSGIILKDLCRLYTQNEDDDILSVICSMYMKGQMTSSDAFKWYALGIEKNLKLTDLYEYYMYSFDESLDAKLDKSVLLYFLYDNHLTAPKKAILYSYVIKNKMKLADTYAAYKNSINQFCFKQLHHGRISKNFAVIYEDCINEGSITDSVAQELPKVMFAYEIICCNPEIVGVYVRHRELRDEVFVPLVHGRAIVHIFTEQAHVFAADKLDNRYVISENFTLNKLLNLDHLADKCFEKNKTDSRLLLYLYDRADHMYQTGVSVAEVRKAVINIEGLSTYQHRKVFSTLIKYYFDNFEGELLDEALMNMDWTQINAADRGRFIEYCAVRHCYDKAMEGILLYGYERISAKRLLQIASEKFAENIDNDDAKLVKLAWHIFNKGKFDENLIKYLCRYFIGGIYEETQIWNTAKSFNLDCKDFEERIIAQMVFTEEIAPDAYEIFFSYYDGGINNWLIKAFLKMLAYKYLVRGWIIPEKTFKYFYDEVRTQENLPCLIASLKYMSGQKNLTDEEKDFADYNINALYEKNIVFPFFKDFYGKFTLPQHIMDEHYVEYISDTDCEVKIHYLITSAQDISSEGGYKSGEFITETMRNVFEGIRVKEFVLFQDELLQYYISEVHSDGERVTRSRSVHFDESLDNSRVSNRYYTLNTMMIAKEMHDEVTLIDMMKEYALERENVKRLFKLMAEKN